MKVPSFSLRPLLPVCACVLLVTGCAWNRTPKKSFSAEACPASPDYALLENWAAHPSKVDAADKTPTDSLHDSQGQAQVDVFFLHPTTLFGPGAWNGDIRDEKLNQRTQKTTIQHQASIFNGVGPVYAPRYRQMTLGGFYDSHDLASNAQAFHLAYADLKAAFAHYLAHFNQGRPIMIAAHSQGSAHAIHLLKDFFDGKPLQSQLVAAYIPGWPTPADTFQVLKPCDSPDQTGCYATWCSFEWGTMPKNMDWYTGAVVVNPISWRMDSLPSDVEAHRGAVMGGYDQIFPQALQAQAHGSILWVTRPQVKGSSVIRGHNFHIADYNLFWLDVRENAVLRARKFLEAGQARN